MSKGSKQRPSQVPPEVVDRNWRRIFGDGVRKYVERKVERLRKAGQ